LYLEADISKSTDVQS